MGSNMVCLIINFSFSISNCLIFFFAKMERCSVRTAFSSKKILLQLSDAKQTFSQAVPD